MAEINLEMQIQCIERELQMRERVYPNLIVSRRMTQPKAEYELAAMKAVFRTLVDLKAEQTKTA